ncbi:hypothetical protein GCM10028772_38010 [Nocardioides ultimimeridianus]
MLETDPLGRAHATPRLPASPVWNADSGARVTDGPEGVLGVAVPANDGGAVAAARPTAAVAAIAATLECNIF